MYQLTIQKADEPAVIMPQRICADTLLDAEVAITGLIARRLNVGNVILIHKGDLKYDIYALGEPIGEAEIRSINSG